MNIKINSIDPAIQTLLSEKGNEWLIKNWKNVGNVFLLNWEKFEPKHSIAAIDDNAILNLRRKSVSGITVVEVLCFDYANWYVAWNKKFLNLLGIVLDEMKPETITDGIVTEFSYGPDYIGPCTENLGPVAAAKKADMRLSHFGFILDNSNSLEEIEKAHDESTRNI